MQAASRSRLWNLTLQKLKNASSCQARVVCLETIRILSRDKSELGSMISGELLNTVVQLAGLASENKQEEISKMAVPDNLKVTVEAQKCLHNLIFNSSGAQRMCCTNGCLQGILQRLKTYRDPGLPHEVKFFDMRMLFLLTALCRDIGPQVRGELHGITYLVEVLDLLLNGSEFEHDSTQRPRTRGGTSNEGVLPPMSDESVDLANEVLKILFNLTTSMDKNNLDEEEEAHMMRLVSVLHDILLCPVNNSAKKDDLHSHTINLLFNMSPDCFDELLTPTTPTATDYDYEGHNMEAIIVLLDFLDSRLEKPMKSMKETLIPILSCLCGCCRGNRIIRKYCRLQVLPPLKDVTNRPEEGDALRNKLCRLLTSPHTDLKELVAEFIFILCKENVDRMIKYTGYGNAAGLFASRGLMLGGRGEVDKYSSESESSDTEEYKGVKDRINPVLGCVEMPHPHPMEGMTDEQKEYEAVKLVNMMDRLARDGIMKPMRVGEDGRPHEVEHILELQKGMRGFPGTEGDEDPDIK